MPDLDQKRQAKSQEQELPTEARPGHPVQDETKKGRERVQKTHLATPFHEDTKKGRERVQRPHLATPFHEYTKKGRDRVQKKHLATPCREEVKKGGRERRKHTPGESKRST